MISLVRRAGFKLHIPGTKTSTQEVSSGLNPLKGVDEITCYATVA